MAKWITTGTGSYRRLPNGKYEMTWRPQGHAGPKLKRRVAWPAQEVREFLASESANRGRVGTGRPVVALWKGALDAYARRLQANECGAVYRAQVMVILTEMQSAGAQLAHFTTAHATEWATARAMALQSQKRPGWARTVNKELNMASGFFRFCLRVLRCIQYNPVSAVPRFPERRKARRDLTPAEYAAVWRISEQSIKDLMDWQLLTGCRIGEAAAMRWADVDRSAGVWTIPDRKAGDSLNVPLCPDLLAVLLRQPRVDPPDGLVWHRWEPAVDVAGHGHGFAAGAPIRRDWWNNVLKARCARAVPPIRRYTSHDLRRAASRWARNIAGLPTSDIQALLGHSTVKTTELYAVADSEGSKRVQQALTGILHNAKEGIA
jgi:integrase